MTPEGERLLTFLRDGCDARPEDRHDAINAVERLLQVEREAKEVLALMDRVIDSFPDNKPPHPSIGECLEGAVALRRLVGG